MNTRTLHLNHPFEETLLKIAGATICVSLLIYAYAVTATIFNIASVKSLDNAIRENRASIGVLEKRYLGAERELTLEKAASMNLVETKKTSHLSLTAPVVVTYRGE